MKKSCADLLHALTHPQAMASFTPSQWDVVVRQARAAGVLGRLGALAQQHGLQQQLPEPVWHALEADLTFAQQQAIAVRYELRRLDRALAKLGIPVLILKGAAYVAMDSPASDGRFMSDIDILVAKPHLMDVESALTGGGWTSQYHDAYDQRYYREWMHELPPMQHLGRHTTLDVHHNLLPETARIKTRPDQVIASSHLLPGTQCLYVPDELDLILHSATHLLHEGEWGHGLRDLSDLYLLIAPRAEQPDFWQRLADRASQLNLQRPLYYALVELRDLFRLAVPDNVLSTPNAILARLMKALLRRGIFSFYPDCHPHLTGIAEFALFVRSHWLRMPAHLLLPHLLYKFWKQTIASDKEKA